MCMNQKNLSSSFSDGKTEWVEKIIRFFLSTVIPSLQESYNKNMGLFYSKQSKGLTARQV